MALELERKISWRYKEGVPALERQLCKELEILPAIARTLANRGVASVADAKLFLYPSLADLHPPEIMKGMPEALDRLEKALKGSEKIIIYGDYDVDGITSAVILYEVLLKLSADVSFYLPSRFEEGYGLSTEALRGFREEGVSLLITVDCGINAVSQLRYAKEIGLDVIITDHHEPLEQELEAVAVLNPKQKDCNYPWKELSGAGVVFKLISGLAKKYGGSEEDLYSYLDLVALGTVADLVPLLGENRILVKYGLEKLNKSTRPGIKYLKGVSGIKERLISTAEISFALAPRLNAAGRLGRAEPAAELLMTQDANKAEELAEKLQQWNNERRAIERKIFDDAKQMIEKDRAQAGEKVIVLAGDGWHQGVLGIVASRLGQLFYRPVIMLSVEGGAAKGSARSIRGFNITSALEECGSLLERFGGHEGAAGMSLPSENIPALRTQLNKLAGDLLQDDDLVPRLYLDHKLSAEEICLSLGEQVINLAPFGVSNPQPVFASEGWEIVSWRFVGRKNNHLKLKIKQGASVLEPIYFFGQEAAKNLNRHRKLRIAFTPKSSFWQERKTLNLELKGIDSSDLFSGNNFSFVDQREIKSKVSYLQGLIEHTDNRFLVFVNTLQQKEAIRDNFTSDEKLFFAHQGAFCEETGEGASFKDLVFYDLPFQLEKLKGLFSSSCLVSKDLRLHLLFGKDDYIANEQLLQSVLPQERSLCLVYEQLCRLPREGLTDDEIFPLVKNRLPFPVTSYLWQKIMAIFKDLNLLQDREGQLHIIKKTDRLPEKLLHSSFYRKSTKILEDCRVYQRYLLDAGSSEILNHMVTLREGRDSDDDGADKKRLGETTPASY